MIVPVPHEGRSDGPWLAYDGDCPFCSTYAKYVRFKDAVGDLHLIDARSGGQEIEEIRAANLDLDEGMVLKFAGNLYHGNDCIHALGLLGSSSSVFNRANAWIFRSPFRARVLYPLLRSTRNLALKLLGKTKINLG